MNESILCEHCGGPLPQTGGLVGACPRCILDLALESTIGKFEDSDSPVAGLPIPTTIARYRILRVIGEGAMGTVYEAEQDQPRRTVALKVIKPGISTPELLRRFEQESQALGRLQHPGIAQIYEAGTADTGFGPQPYFAMELIRGKTLSGYAKDHHLNTRQRLEMVARIAEAVQHAHQRGLIHRDLKPGNIMVDETGQPKILDFGIARATDSDVQATSETNLGQLVGTLAYMSPEQVLADPLELDTRSDVYSLGVILYELLAGRLPYTISKKLNETIHAIQEEDPAKLSAVNRSYRGDIETIVARALEKDKTRRYGSAAELAADIHRYLHNEPIVARPPSTRYQLEKFVRRHKALVAGIAAVFVVLVAGISASRLQATRANRERDRAVQAELKTSVERDRAAAAEQTATTQRDLALSAEQQATNERNRAVVAEAAARQAAQEVKLQLAASSFYEATVRADRGDTSAALAFLARCLRLDPSNSSARTLALNLILYGGGARIGVEHQDRVTAAAWSPDGTRVLTGSADKTARIWDARTGQPVGAPLQHQGSVTTAAWSPDGMRVLTGSADKTARIWDARTGQPVGAPLQHQGSVTAVAWSPDGMRVLTGSADKTARIWDARSGLPVGSPLQHPDRVTAVAWSPDGTRVLIGSQSLDGQPAQIWDTRTGKPVGSPLQHQGSITAVAWSPDGTRVLTGSAGRTVRIWDARSGLPVGSPLQHQGSVTSVAWSPDGTRVLTGSADKTARIWDARTGQPVGAPFQHQGSVTAVAWSPDGTRALTGSADWTARIWDARTGQEVGASFQNQGSVTAVAWSPDGSRVLTGSADNTARIWDARTGQPVGAPFQHQGSVGAVAWSPDGTRVLTGTTDNTAQIWGARTGQPVGSPLQHQDHATAVAWTPEGTRVPSGLRVTAVAWSPDGSRVLTGSFDWTARIWEARTGKPVGPPLQHQSFVEAVAWSPDGTRVLTGSADQTARIWDARTGQPVGALLQHQDSVGAVAWSPDGTRVLTGSADRTARIWDARTGQPVGAPFQHQGSVGAVAWSSDGTRVLTGSLDRTARIWDTRTGQEVGAPLQHQSIVGAVAWSPDGTRVLTGSADNSARIWDARTGQPVGPPLKHPSFVEAVAWSPDGTRVLTGSADNSARIWDVPTGLPNEAAQLAEIAESIGGLRVNDAAGLERIPDWSKHLNALSLGSPQPNDHSVAALLHWALANPYERTISPFSAMTVDEYVQRLLDLGLRAEAEQQFPSHRLLRTARQ